MTGRRVAGLVLGALGMLAGCSKHNSEPAHTFAYITNSGSNSVSVLDLATLKIARTLSTGNNPTGVTASPTKDEVYVVNTDSGTVSVINSASNQVAGSISVGRSPYTISVTTDGKHGWVANAGSNTVTALDLDAHRVDRTGCGGRAARDCARIRRWQVRGRGQSRR